MHHQRHRRTRRQHCIGRSGDGNESSSRIYGCGYTHQHARNSSRQPNGQPALQYADSTEQSHCRLKCLCAFVRYSPRRYVKKQKYLRNHVSGNYRFEEREIELNRAFRPCGGERSHDRHGLHRTRLRFG